MATFGTGNYAAAETGVRYPCTCMVLCF